MPARSLVLPTIANRDLEACIDAPSVFTIFRLITSHILRRQQPFQDLGRNYFDERERSAIARQSVRRLA